MGVINKIRQRAGLVVGSVAVAMVLFLLGGDLLSPTSVLLRGRREVGDIRGEGISVDEYQSVVEELAYNYRLNYNKSPDAEALYHIREQAWQELIRRKVYVPQYEAVGLAVSDEELIDMVQGDNISKTVENAFRDKETNQFDKEEVKKFLGTLPDAGQERQLVWSRFEDNILGTRLSDKYKSLFLKTNYVSDLEAEKDYGYRNERRDLSYLYVPFSSFADSLYAVSDDEMKGYLEAHAHEYQKEWSRSVVYVTFPIKPSLADTTYAEEELLVLREDFVKADNDTVFAKIHTEEEEAYQKYTLKDLPEALSERLDSLVLGTVVGPVKGEDDFVLYKVSDTEEGVEADAEADAEEEVKVYARAKHILFKADETDDDAKQKAKSEAQGVLTKLKRQQATFAEMAKIHGTDATASKGGDLGWFGEGEMVAPFEKAVFEAKKKGLMPKLVETTFGYHIVSVTEFPRSTTFMVSEIKKRVVAGDETRNKAYQEASAFSIKAKDLESLKQAAEEANLPVEEAKTVGQNDRSISGLSKARDMVVWLYNQAKKGQVSDIFERDDEFVLLAMEGEQPKGLVLLESVREEIERKVRNEKKAEDILQKLSKTSGSLDDRAQPFDGQGRVYTAKSVLFTNNSLQNIGQATRAVGVAFALKEDTLSEPITLDDGIVVLQVDNITESTPKEDLSEEKERLENRREGPLLIGINRCLEEFSNIKDKRYKFF